MKQNIAISYLNDSQYWMKQSRTIKWRIQWNILSQGCRFGPESKPNTGNKYLDP